MKTFLAVCGLDGSHESLALLTRIIDERRPEVVLFAGGVFRFPVRSKPHNDSRKRNCAELTLLRSLLSLTDSRRCLLAAIPGPQDSPLPSFLRAGILAQARHCGVKVVHGAVMTSRSGLAIAGVAGELSLNDDACEPVIRCSRASADYFLSPFLAAREPHKVLLLAVPPTGLLGGKSGNSIVQHLIETYHPRLCVTGGDTAQRGFQQIADTLIVNPGRISDGSAAWIDLNRKTSEQVELINLREDRDAVRKAVLTRRALVRVSSHWQGKPIPVFSLEPQVQSVLDYAKIGREWRPTASIGKKRHLASAAVSKEPPRRRTTASRNPPVPNGGNTGTKSATVVA